MAIQEIIKYEGNNETLIYKYPKEDFNTLSQLIVHESQEAIFFSEGQALDSFTAGRYTLETKNIPLISSIRNLVSGGTSPFHCEVYFINKATLMDVIWGTPSQVTVKDPNYGYSYNVGASGSFSLKIIDARKLLINLVGTETELTTKNVQKYFKDLITTRVKNYIAIELSKYSYNVLNQHLNDISKQLESQIQDDISTYGIKVFNYMVSAISIAEDDLEKLKDLDNSVAQKRFEALGDRDAKVIAAEGEAKAREIQGYTWQQEQQFDVSKAFAQNEGFAANPANMMAQIPLAFSMGDMLNNNVQGTMQQSGQICGECKAVLQAGAKFCSNCGTKVQIAQTRFCANCGAKLDTTMKFCSECGEKVM